MSAVLDLIGGLGNALAALGTLIATIFAALWSRERGKRKEAEHKAETHEAMREHEHEASQMDDTSLADRLTRR